MIHANRLKKTLDLLGITVRRMALAWDLAKLVEENAFAPFVRP
jgi:hypothetical protein